MTMDDDEKVIELAARRVRKRQPLSEPTPDIIKLGVDVHRIVDQCSEALLRCDDLFCRSGEIVRVVRDGAPPPNVKREPGAPTIRAVAPATLLEELTRVQQFAKFDHRASHWVAAIPNAATIAALAARGSWKGMRALKAIVEAPALRPDGSILQTRGWDSETSYLYEPSADFPIIDDHPSRAEAIAARDELLEVVSDFPFATDPHRAAWLAFVLTLFARPAIDGCIPLIGVDATSPGTGKGRLVDATAILATGREATKTPLPQDDEECRKRITALLIEGDRLAVLDNITNTIALPSLDAALTATMWSDRMLGKNASVKVANLMTWVATGNNLSIGGDLARRTLHIRLESKHEDPENRTDFKHNPLLPWVKRERPRLVRAALTILRAHAVDGRPSCGVKTWGSFESWSSIVAAAVAWVDLPDPQLTREGLSAVVDTTKQAIRSLISGWARLTRELPDGITVKHAVEALYSSDRLRGEAPPDGFDDLRDAIEALVSTQPGRAPNATKLGQRMRAFRRRLIGGRMLDGDVDRKGVMRWRVKDAGDAGDAWDAPNPSRETVSDNSKSMGGNIAGIPSIPGSPNSQVVDRYERDEEHAFSDLLGGAE